MRQSPTIRHASASSRPRRRRHRPRSRTPRRPTASARPGRRRAPACSQHLADGGAVMREIGVQPHEAPVAGLVDSRRSRPRPAAAACRRRANSARCGIRRRHGACRPRRPATARCAVSRSRAAASPAAAMLVCAAAATRNDDGSCGSSPVSVTASSAAGSPPAEVQRSARISRGVCMGNSLRVAATLSLIVIIRESGFIVMYGRPPLGKGFFGISANGSGSGHVYGLEKRPLTAGPDGDR